jgi:cobalamin biosynthesis protein CobD/CbiB
MAGSSHKWRTAFFVTVIIAVLLVAFLGYSVIDQAVTVTYMSDGYSRTEKDLDTARRTLLSYCGRLIPRDLSSKPNAQFS